MSIASSEIKPLSMKAWLLGEHLDVRRLERGDVVARGPLTVRAGEHGHAMLFRFGSVVLIDVSPVEEANFLREIEPFVQEPLREPESETAELACDGEQKDLVDRSGRIWLHDFEVSRLQVVAEVLAKSTVLAQYEARVSKIFDRVEDLADRLGRGARLAKPKALLREIGSVLLIQARTVGRVEIAEKPELTWDRPELDRIYEHLSHEYELRERDDALTRKLELISRTAETYLELLHNRRSLRVEWYIVFLILAEILLFLYELFIR